MHSLGLIVMSFCSWRMLDPADVGRVEPEVAAAKLRENLNSLEEASNAKALLRRLDISGVGFVTKGQFARYVHQMLVAHTLSRVSYATLLH